MFDELVSFGEFVFGLFQENLTELLYSLGLLAERGLLVLSFSADSPVPCEQNVQVSDRVMDDLHSVEDVLGVLAFMDIDFSEQYIIKAAIFHS